MKIIIGIILVLFGIGCIVAAGIIQMKHCYQLYGAIFEQVFIPHKSAWLYLGAIPFIAGWVMLKMED